MQEPVAELHVLVAIEFLNDIKAIRIASNRDLHTNKSFNTIGSLLNYLQAPPLARTMCVYHEQVMH